MAQQKTLRLGIRTSLAQIDLTDPDALHRTTLHGQTDNVLKLLSAGTDVDLIDSNGWTALQVASAHGRLAITNILLTHGANTEIKMDGSTALHMASTKGYPEIATLLLKYKAAPDVKRSDGATPLHLAARNGWKDVVRALAKGGANLEEPSDDRGYNALHMACELGYSKCATELLLAGANPDARAAEGLTPLMIAAVSDCPDVAMVLLKSGADVDANTEGGRTASIVAAYFGSSLILGVLIAEGANLDIVDEAGLNALHFAIAHNKLSTALLLLKQRIRVTTLYSKQEYTALHLAVKMNQSGTVRALLAKGANPEACDADGDTALQWAVEGNRMAIVKILLRNGAQINRPNDKTRETVLHWAVKYGLVSMTQALLAHGSDPSSMNLDNLQKGQRHYEHGEIDDEDFETCKILVETASLTKMETQNPEQFEWPLGHGSDTCVEEEDQKVFGSARKNDTSESITNPIYDIPDQAAAKSFIADFQDKVIHDGVKCAGPHCAQLPENLHGIRYKCTWCDEVNLCSICISSFFNNHQHYHPMIRCLLPTHVYKIEEIDENTKQSCVHSVPQGGITPQDITHIMCAITDEIALRQLQIDLNIDLSLDLSPATSLLNEPTPVLFAICKQQQSKESKPRIPRIIESNKWDTDSLSVYKIGDYGTINLTHFPLGQKSLIKDDAKVIHHQDPELLAKTLCGVMKRFDYHQDETFYKWAWEGRAVTRIIDLKPGEFDDKIEIELRIVDLRQKLDYEALSYTWKETAYERALMRKSTPEMDVTLRSIAKYSHGVYCHNTDGSEAFLTVNTGLRDALKRLRDSHETKTLWIDQLVINQEDVKERAFQVQAMRHCYNQARRVIVWTGEEDMHTQNVFETYKKIAHTHRNLKQFPSPSEFLQLTGTTSIEGSILEAMYEYFHRPVFGRSWCIQEIVVGQKVVIKCGEFEIDWVDIRFAALALSSVPWLEDLYVKRGGPRKSTASVSLQEKDYVGALTVDSLGNLTEVITIAGLREDFQSGKETPLETILYATGRSQVSEPRDKIYAVLGIRGAKIYPVRPADNIQADYEKSDAEAFTTATKFCIQQSNSLHICGMTDTVSRKRTIGLPSWVPDYSYNSLSSLFAYCRPAPQIPYNACGDVPLTVAWPYEQHSNILITSSCYIETIETVSEHSMSSMGIKQFPTIFSEWSSLVEGKSTYPTGEFLPDIFLVTCCVDSAGRSRLRSSSQPEAFLETMGMLLAKSFMQYLMEKCPDGTPMELETYGNKTAGSILMEAMEKFPTAWGLDETPGDNVTSDERGSLRAVTEASSSGPIHSNDTSYGECDPILAETESSAKETDRAMIDLGRPSLGPEDKGRGKEVKNPHNTARDDDAWTRAPRTGLDPRLHTMAVESIVMACFNRKFFVTSNNYFGLGPADMQKGDEIHVLSGTKVPFVMRKFAGADARINGVDHCVIDTMAEDGLDPYQIIGECFVHGFMQGEVESRDDMVWNGIGIY